ncbi:RNase adapter RapZ [Abyssisolibacter fermentans]|uniref:RNase adapter RapZ n=1 Tax=Abyssisolibacter fermentans TaxID=1766203 RepID=UPI000832FC55|nr:RNase adapter RapZ [Abyssisolibacter fermentans]
MQFVIITGLSGAGKSQAMKIMEDIGYYCMDNLPPSLIPKFIDLYIQSKDRIKEVALVVDIRGGKFFNDLFENLDELKADGYEYKILFLDCDDSVLVHRYKELRRPHPLNPQGSIIEGINKERNLLEEVKKKSDYIINTSNFTTGMLKEEIKKLFLEGKEVDNFIVSISSFGYKYGIVIDADLVFDVRFLPNPHYVDELRPMTGNDQKVKDYVMKWNETKVFVDKLTDMIDFLIPFYIKEGKMQLMIAIGCTGGKHRSVTIANYLYEYLKSNGHKVAINHRDSYKRKA